MSSLLRLPKQQYLRTANTLSRSGASIRIRTMSQNESGQGVSHAQGGSQVPGKVQEQVHQLFTSFHRSRMLTKVCRSHQVSSISFQTPCTTPIATKTPAKCPTPLATPRCRKPCRKVCRRRSRRLFPMLYMIRAVPPSLMEVKVLR